MAEYTPITLFTLDEKPHRNVHTARSWKVEQTIEGVHMLEFVCDYDDAPYMQQMILFDGDFYTTVSVERSSYDDSATVRAETIALSLQDRIVELLDMRSKTVHDIVYRSLNRTAWAIGHIDKADMTISVRYEDKSPLYIIREVAEITNQVLRFDTLERRIYMYDADEFGKSVNTIFAYGKNVEDIEVIEEAPRATTLIPFGKNGLDVKEYNGDSREISDYSWYTDVIGIPLEQAERRYKKTVIWRDEEVLSAAVLMEKARHALREMAHPRITYKIPVVHTGMLVRDLQVGDWGYVVDYERDIKVKVKVVRVVSHDDPTQDIVELDYYDAGIGDDSKVSGSTGKGSETVVSHEYNKEDITINELKPLVTVRVTAFKSTHAVVGVTIVGKVSGEGLFEAFLQVGANREPMTDIVHTVSPDYRTMSGTFVIQKFPEGTHDLTLYAKSSTSVFFEKGRAQLFITGDGLLGGGRGDGNIRASEDIDVTSKVTDVAKVVVQRPHRVAWTETVKVGTSVTDILSIEITLRRDEFAKVSNYPELVSPTQEGVDAFIDVTHKDKKVFYLVRVGDRLAVITTAGKITETNGRLEATSNMYLYDVVNDNTEIGRVYEPTEGLEVLEKYKKGWG